MLKGRSQYLCLARLRAASGGDTARRAAWTEFATQLTRLERYAAETDVGDAAGIDGVPPTAWRAVGCGPNECPGAARCPEGDECFAEQARVRADGASVLIAEPHAVPGPPRGGRRGAP